MTVLDHYRSLQAASHRMLEEASAGRWAEVSRLERRCESLIDALRRLPERLALNREDNHERLRILCDIVRVDAKVRHLAEPWLGDLDRLMSGAFGARPAAPGSDGPARTDGPARA